MKLKLALLLLMAAFIALIAWLVQVPEPIRAGQVPEKYRDTVAKGLDFLVKHQHKDGHWEGDDGKHPVAMTGFVGIALLMERQRSRGGRSESATRKEPRTDRINKAVDWLIQQSKRDGLIFSGHDTETSRYMEGHGLATMFLAGAYQFESDSDRRKKIEDVVVRAAKTIGKAQSAQGGWYHTSKTEGHDFDAIAPTVIQVQALEAVNIAGIPYQPDSLAAGAEYMRKAVAKLEASKEPADRRKRLGITIRALPCCFNVIREAYPTTSPYKQWHAYCKLEWPAPQKIQFGTDDLDHYYYAQALFIVGDKQWSDYRAFAFHQLQAAQEKDGGWPSCVGIGAGRVYSTALWCTVLQLDNRMYPAMHELELPVT